MGQLCKVCWETIGPKDSNCKSKNSALKCGMDFGVGAEASAAAATGDEVEGVLPAGAWSKAPSSFVPYDGSKGTGFKKVYAKCVLSFDKPMDVPGTDFELVCPMQTHVNPDIVDAKIAEFKSLKSSVTPVVPVVYNNKTGRVTINGDGHHTFVACLKSKRPVCLLLYKTPYAGTHKNWKQCTYKKFDQNQAAHTGTKFA